MRNDELMHYGVKGMRWGEHIFAKDYNINTKKQFKVERRKDNNKAFEIGRSATLYGKAASMAAKKVVKLENKIDKEFSKTPMGSEKTQKLYKKWVDETKTLARLTEKYGKIRNEGEKHCKQLVKKYGSENVNKMTYKPTYLGRVGMVNMVNERTVRGKQIAGIMLTNLASAGALALGSPIGVVEVPRPAKAQAYDLYRHEQRSIKKGSR